MIQQLTASTSLNKQLKYSGLDGIRAYAALAIVLMHVLSNICVKPTDIYLTREVIPFFTDFTLLFMMVSAFSMCCGYYEKIKNGAITPNAFYKKRYVRILPFFILLNLIGLAVEPSIGALQEVYANLTLAFNLLPQNQVEMIGVGWFLGIIFVFYMLFPFFVFLTDNKRRAWLVLLVAIGLLFIAFTRFGHPTRSNIIFCFPYFLVGGLVFLYKEKLVDFLQKRSWLGVVGVLATIVAYFAFRGSMPNEYASYMFELLFFAVVVIYAISSKDKLLNNRIVKYLAGISMEIYLCHMLIFRIVEKCHIENFIPNPDVLYVICCALVIAGAICFSHCYKMVERRLPFLK